MLTDVKKNRGAIERRERSFEYTDIKGERDGCRKL